MRVVKVEIEEDVEEIIEELKVMRKKELSKKFEDLISKEKKGGDVKVEERDENKIKNRRKEENKKLKKMEDGEEEVILVKLKRIELGDNEEI